MNGIAYQDTTHLIGRHLGRLALRAAPTIMPRKRTRDEMEASGQEEKTPEPSMLQRLRNMWEFASVMQYIFMFGKAIKIDEDFDIEVRPTFIILRTIALQPFAAE